MQRSVLAHGNVRVVIALGVAVAVLGCAAPGGSLAPSTATLTQPPSPTPVVAVTAAPIPVATPLAQAHPAASTATASAPAAMLSSATLPATSVPSGSIQLEMFGPPPQLRPKDLVGTAGDIVTFYLVNDSPAREEHGATPWPSGGSSVWRSR